MNVDDMIIISIDDHVIEPPDMFDAHVPARYRDQAPKLVRDEKGFDTWVFEGEGVGMVGLNATVSWPKEEWGMDPSSLAEMRTGAYLVGERVRDMNRNGVLASMCFPSFVGFSGPQVPGCKGQGSGPGNAQGLQRLAHRRVVRLASWPVHSAGDRPAVGHERAGGGGTAGRGQGLPGRSACRSCRICSACPPTRTISGTRSSPPSAMRRW